MRREAFQSPVEEELISRREEPGVGTHQPSSSRSDTSSSTHTDDESLEPFVPALDGESSAASPSEDGSSERELSESHRALWQRCLDVLREELDTQLFQAYVAPLSIKSCDERQGHAVIAAPSKFLCGQVERSYRARIATLLAEISGIAGFRVTLTVDETLSSLIPDQQHHADPSPAPFRPVVLQQRPVRSEQPATAASEASRSSAVNALGSQINPRYTFSDFVVGNSNQFCHAAARRVAEQPGRSYNPLFIYGGVGLGKTHLLHAIANTVLERNPAAEVLYMSSETFTNELIQSLRNERMNEFKQRLRSVEVLLIDDIQFLCGKERTQEEFFHTFNSLYAAKRQIVVTSDKLPQEIPGIEERLQTRFSWGLTADLQAPDFETRVAILKRKASHDGIDLPEEVAHLIAERISSNVRELEGALTRLHAVSSLQNQPITMEFTKAALKPLLLPKAVNISVDDIKKTVADFFNIRLSEMVSKKRTKNLSFPRHIAMYLCRKHTTCSYPEIGEHFGGRDHSSVIHASNVVSTKIANDPDTKQLVGELERRLLGS